MKESGKRNAKDHVGKINKRHRSNGNEALNQNFGHVRQGTGSNCLDGSPIKKLNQHATDAATNSHDSVGNPEILSKQQQFPNYPYILAPMVGASELPFRFLCRKYGAQLCYTPMMSSQSFATSSDYRKDYFGTANSERVHDADHPIYAHVHANTVQDFVAAAQQALAMNCDGIDLNLGCPQRTAYIGHYGSYLCTSDTQTHQHISEMLTAAAQAIQYKIPITAKIRLLHPTDSKPTLDLCRTLHNNGLGASLIAIHARPRASWERTGPSARDGPANLQQVASIAAAIQNDDTNTTDGKEKCQSQKNRLRIITNGNTITYNDVVNNLQLTKADGIMSAEGLLDNPALYLPRLHDADVPNCTIVNDGSSTSNPMEKVFVTVWTLKEEFRYKYHNYKPIEEVTTDNAHVTETKSAKIRSIHRKLRNVEEKLQALQQKQSRSSSLLDQKTQSKHERYQNKQQKLQKKLRKLQLGSHHVAESADNIAARKCSNDDMDHFSTKSDVNDDPHIERRTVTLQSLHEISSDKVLLGMEYLDWATIYPTTLRTVVFHIRRMCKAELVQYQQLQPCLQATSIDKIREILNRIIQYRINPETFVYDSQREQEEKDAIARQKYEEGKRKAFEERMIRKAKREKKDDLFYYLNIGAELPTPKQMEHYLSLDRDALIPIWKEKHSQHCISYHMDPDKCQRGRACAFLHVDTTSKASLQERDECAG
jgi:tRNA-dihydrouridine synthase 1